MGFFIIVVTWTVLWTGYNILATKVTAFHWHAFDPFPAFVAYLLVSNVVQITLMPLIMVGQNLQARHSEARAEADYLVNQKAFTDTEAILARLSAQDQQMLEIVRLNQTILEGLRGAGAEFGGSPSRSSVDTMIRRPHAVGLRSNHSTAGRASSGGFFPQGRIHDATDRSAQRYRYPSHPRDVPSYGLGRAR